VFCSWTLAGYVCMHNLCASKFVQTKYVVCNMECVLNCTRNNIVRVRHQSNAWLKCTRNCCYWIESLTKSRRQLFSPSTKSHKIIFHFRIKFLLLLPTVVDFLSPSTSTPVRIGVYFLCSHRVCSWTLFTEEASIHHVFLGGDWREFQSSVIRCKKKIFRIFTLYGILFSFRWLRGVVGWDVTYLS